MVRAELTAWGEAGACTSGVPAPGVMVELDDVGTWASIWDGAGLAVDLTRTDELPDQVVRITVLDRWLKQEIAGKSDDRDSGGATLGGSAVSNWNGEDSPMKYSDATGGNGGVVVRGGVGLVRDVSAIAVK